MGTVLKQVLGIDVAQNELVVTFGRLIDDLTIDLVAHKVFKNTDNGFSTLLLWVKKYSCPEVSLRFVMEATGGIIKNLSIFWMIKAMKSVLCYRIKLVIINARWMSKQ
jgi:hypothetical protein